MVFGGGSQDGVSSQRQGEHRRLLGLLSLEKDEGGPRGTFLSGGAGEGQALLSGDQ